MSVICGQLCMCSTVKDRAVIDIMQSVKVHTSIVPDLLAIHALTGADTSAATFGIGKIKALKVARTATDTQADEAIVLEQAASFILACHAISADVPAFVKSGSKCED